MEPYVDDTPVHTDILYDTIKQISRQLIIILVLLKTYMISVIRVHLGVFISNELTAIDDGVILAKMAPAMLWSQMFLLL